jgi:hypothetical protein
LAAGQLYYTRKRQPNVSKTGWTFMDMNFLAENGQKYRTFAHAVEPK